MEKNKIRKTLETVREREKESLAKICFNNHVKKYIKEEKIGYVDRCKSYV